MRRLKIYVDGSSKGNPGDAGYGFVIEDEEGNRLASGSGYIGVTTSNAAEYTALIFALLKAKEFNPRSVEILSDSELLVKQISGEYGIHSDLLKPLYLKAKSLLDSFESFSVRKISRSENREADRLASAAARRRG